MKKASLILTCILLGLVASAQVDFEVKELSSTMTPDNELIRTIKITVINKTDHLKIVYLRNDCQTTGYCKIGCMFRNPMTLLGELAGPMDYSDDLLPLTIFADWFRIIKPNEQFVFYFQRNSDLDIESLMKLIRCRDFTPMPYSEELNWKEDEIIIHLPDK